VRAFRPKPASRKAILYCTLLLLQYFIYFTVLYCSIKRGPIPIIQPTYTQNCTINHNSRLIDLLQGRVQFSDLINASVLLFGRTIKYCVTNKRAEVSNLTQYFILQNSRVSYRQYSTVLYTVS
jgi:hypothetical protein